MFTREQIEKAVKAKGYKYFENGDYNMNVIGIRNPGSHHVGLHQGKYEALKQKANVKVYRDANKDMAYDESKITEGVYGINIHKAGQDSTWVDFWSMGCTVFKRVKDFDVFMKFCKTAAKLHGNSFTYTVIESKDIA